MNQILESGNLEALKLYSKHRNVDRFNNFAVRKAAELGRLDMVQYLCEEMGCDPTAKFNDAIRRASHNGYIEVVKYLVSKNCDPLDDFDGQPAIVMACDGGYIHLIQYFVSIGCNVKKYDQNIVLQQEVDLLIQ